jgi:hypothetical protein
VSDNLKDRVTAIRKKGNSVRTDDLLLPQYSELIVNDACSAAPTRRMSVRAIFVDVYTCVED